MKEIIFITPDLANGGAERVTAILAEELARQSIRVYLGFMKDSKKRMMFQSGYRFCIFFRKVK